MVRLPAEMCVWALEWGVQSTVAFPAGQAHENVSARTRQATRHCLCAISISHAADVGIYFAMDTPKFASTTWIPGTYAIELADLAEMRFTPCLGDLASRPVGGRGGHGGYGSIATMQVYERDTGKTAVRLQVSDPVLDAIAYLRAKGKRSAADALEAHEKSQEQQGARTSGQHTPSSSGSKRKR